MILWIELSAILLMAPLVYLPMVKMDGDLEKDLSGNFSVDNNAERSTSGSIENSTFPSVGQSFFTTSEVPTTSVIGMLEKEKKRLEDKLGETLKSAISSGQVIMIAGTEEKNLTKEDNSTSSILSENLSTSSQSSIDELSRAGAKRMSESDLEIAPSQQHLRAIPHNYFGDEENENIEDLLAITEYEPQKLGTSQARVSNDRSFRDESSVKVSSSTPLPEEEFYEVPKQQNFSRDSQKPSDTTGYNQEPESNAEESQSEIKIVPSKTNPTQKPQKISSFRYSNFFDRNPEKVYVDSEEWFRGPRHLKAIPKTNTPNGIVPKVKEERSKVELNVTRVPNRTNSESIQVHFSNKQNNFNRPSSTVSGQEDLLPIKPTESLAIVYPKLKKNYVNFAPNNRPLPDYDLSLSEKKKLESRRVAETSEEMEYEESDYGSDSKNSQRSNESIDAEYPEDSNESETAENRSVKETKIDESRKKITLVETTTELSEEEEEPKASKVYGNSAVPIGHPVYDSYGHQISVDRRKLTNQQNFVPYVDQRLGAVTYGNIPIKPKHQVYDYPGTTVPITPVNYLHPMFYNYQNGPANPLAVAPRPSPPVAERLPNNLLTTSSYESYEEYDEKEPNGRAVKEKMQYPSYVVPYSRIHLTTAAPLANDYDYVQENANYAPVLGISARVASVEAKNLPNTLVRLSPKIGVPNVHQDDSDRHYIDRADDYGSYDSGEPNDGFQTGPNERNLPSGAIVRLPVIERTVTVNGNNRQRPQNNLQIIPVYQGSETSVKLPKKNAELNRRVDIEPNSWKSDKVRHEKQKKISGDTQRSLSVPVARVKVPKSTKPRRIEAIPLTEKLAESNRRIDVVEDYDEQDEVAEGTGHDEHHEKKHEDHHEEKGGGEKHEEDHHSSAGKEAEKGYKEWHEFDKGKKGHHDEESHENEYHDHKGDKKKHEEEGAYHKEHHHGEKGSKEAEFGEKGKHQKGHSTKGEHVIHKKDEYEKKTEFYDESHEEDSDEKEGEYHQEHEHEKGGHEKHGHHDGAYHEEKHGEKGEDEKGHHWHEDKGHDDKEGDSHEHHHGEKYGKKGGHEEGVKWSHEKGHKGR